jgi:ABC-type cobalamin/Fe3+-siderophores transport system ATPase subunit
VSSVHSNVGFVSSLAVEHLLAELLLIHSITDFCLLGPRGSGKSTVLHEFARRLGYTQLETIVLYQVNNTKLINNFIGYYFDRI